MSTPLQVEAEADQEVAHNAAHSAGQVGAAVSLRAGSAAGAPVCRRHLALAP